MRSLLLTVIPALLTLQPAVAWDLDDLGSPELQEAARAAAERLGPDQGAVHIEPALPLTVLGVREQEHVLSGLAVNQRRELLDLKAERLGADLQPNGYRFVFSTDEPLPGEGAAVGKAHDACQKLAALIREARPFQVVITGHTDSRGKRVINLIRSQREADTVADGLIRQGVAPRILKTHGLGSSQTHPAAESASQRLNRRVEVFIELEPEIGEVRTTRVYGGVRN